MLCRVIERDADATEIGLAENVVRLAMHPADQFEAFRQLIDKGSDAAGIAARFGVSEATVAKRLKLGRVSPAILDAYRAGALGLEEVQAFAVSDDHAAQERVWDGCDGRHAHPHAIRRALTEGEIPSDDRRARFVGMTAYEEAGGAMRRDLFDAEGGGYLQDVALLDRLVQHKLDTLADTIRSEGWRWVEAYTDFGYEMRGQYRRCIPDEMPLLEAEASELATLEAEYDTLRDAQYDEDGEEDPATTARLNAIEQRIGALSDREPGWTPEQMATAGAVIHLSHDGEAEIERGLVRKDDAPKDDAADENAGAETDASSPAPSLPATLTEELTARRTAALRATLARNPDVALAAVAHALARRAFYPCGGDSCLDITAKHHPLTLHRDRQDECAGQSAFDAERGKWTDRLPADADALWGWCLGQTQDTLLDLLAVSVAHTVDAVREKHMREDAPRLLHADALAKALSFDMRAWFQPTAANYFGRVTRDRITQALTEAGRPARTRSWSKLKKADLAQLAEREIAGTGWLPQPLRMQADAMQPIIEQTDTPVAAAA